MTDSRVATPFRSCDVILGRRLCHSITCVIHLAYWQGVAGPCTRILLHVARDSQIHMNLRVSLHYVV
jgi:hypothetical protein